MGVRNRVSRSELAKAQQRAKKMRKWHPPCDPARGAGEETHDTTFRIKSVKPVVFILVLKKQGIITCTYKISKLRSVYIWLSCHVISG
jgi:hypothetical protein